MYSVVVVPIYALEYCLVRITHHNLNGNLKMKYINCTMHEELGGEAKSSVYPGSQMGFGVMACCNRYVDKTRIYIHLGKKCAWTTRQFVCWKFEQYDRHLVIIVESIFMQQKHETKTKLIKKFFFIDFAGICHVN